MLGDALRRAAGDAPSAALAVAAIHLAGHPAGPPQRRRSLLPGESTTDMLGGSRRAGQAGPRRGRADRRAGARATASRDAKLRAAATRRLSKADRIYLALKEAIVRGELAPGAAIDKPALCDRFAVSRLPVTTAINRLAYEGLVLIERAEGLLRRPHPARRRAAVDDGAPRARGRGRRRGRPAAAPRDARGDAPQPPLPGGGDRRQRLRRLPPARRRLPPAPDRRPGPAPRRRAARRAAQRISTASAACCCPSPAAWRRRSPSTAPSSTRSRGASRAAAERAMRRHLDVVIERLVAFERQHPDFFGP